MPTNHRRRIVTAALIAATITTGSLRAAVENEQTADTVAAFLPSRAESGAFLKMRSEIAEVLAKEVRLKTYAVASKDMSANALKLLYVHEVLRRTGEKQIEAEVQRDPAFRKFIVAFFSDAGWMEEYLTTMNVPSRTVRGLQVLSEIYAAEGASENFGRYKGLSAAIASAWCGCQAERFRNLENAPEAARATPVSRFRFFRNAHREGRLNSAFDQLRSWDMEFLVGTFPWDDASLEFLNRNVQLPSSGFLTIAWCGDYSYTTVFGDYVQAGAFYTPWQDSMGMAENIARHGGVCGAVSHYAMAAAVAHGIPGTTMGQPGHCAYGLRPSQGHWIGGYGGPEGTQHYSCWGAKTGEESFSHLTLADEVYGNRPALLAAVKHGAYFRLLNESARSRQLAAEALTAALAASPRHLGLLREKVTFMEQGRPAPAEWIALAKYCVDKAEGIPGRVLCDMAGNILEKQVPNGGSDAEKLDVFRRAMPSLLSQNTSWNWDLSNALTDVSSSLTPKARKTFFGDVLDSAWANPAKPGSGKILPWICTRVLAGDITKNDFYDLYRDKVSGAIGKAGKDDGLPSLTPELASKALADWTRSAINTADSKGKKDVDMRSFLLQEYYRLVDSPASLKTPEKIVKPLEGDRPAGVAISGDAVVKTPHSPEKLLFGLQGLEQVAFGPAFWPSKNPGTVEIELPVARPSSGILLVSGAKKAVAAIVSISADGTTWTKVAEQVIPANGRLPVAFNTDHIIKNVKVELAAKGGGANLNNLIVFGKDIK